MEVYTVFGLSQPPKKLRSFGDSNEFYCYFPAPLPDVIVVFCTEWGESMPNRMNIELHLDSEDNSICKTIGNLSNSVRAACFKGNWEKDEQLIGDEIQEKGRLIKIMVVEDSLAEVDSQDSGIQDTEGQVSPSLKFSDSENIENENCSAKKRKSREAGSLLGESKQTPKRATSVKRKSVFAFGDPLDNKKNEQGKNDSPLKRHKEDSICQPLNRTPKSKKGCISPVKTPKGRAFEKGNAKSPATPGISGLKVPSPRWGHSFCKVNEKKALIIGGQGLKSQISKDSIWQYDFESNEFERVEDDSNGASRRMGHTAIFDRRTELVYVFGGSKNKKWYSDINILNSKTKKWVTVETTGKAPVRAYHSCTLLHDELLIFGGVFPNPDPTPDGCSNDIHFFNTITSSWYKPIVSGEQPKARSGHSACLVDGLLYIFGGWDAPVCFNDLWALDTGLMSFRKLEASGQQPSPRSWHGTALSANQENIIVYGGYNGDIALKDVHIFRIATKTWSLVGDGSHLAIAGHKMLTIKTKNNACKSEERVMVFGGGDNEGSFFNDIVELEQGSQ